MTAHELPRDPSVLGVTFAPAGRRWDAVRVSGPLGDRLIAALGTRCGDVIRDDRTYLFLVPPSTGERFVTDGVVVYGPGRHVLLPKKHRVGPPGPYWMRTVSSERVATSATDFEAALLEVAL